MVLSSLYEGVVWTGYIILSFVLILLGNAILLTSIEKITREKLFNRMDLELHDFSKLNFCLSVTA